MGYEVGTAVAVDHVEHFGVRQKTAADTAEPAAVVEAGGVDNESVFFPLADGVAEPGRIPALRLVNLTGNTQR